jgi:hypothetical protein
MPDGMNMGGPPTYGGLQTFDGVTRDSAGAFLLGELERLDPALHEPLVSITWSRDIDLRSDITTGDEWSSFTNSTFGASGGFATQGISWIGKATNAIQSVSLDIGKTALPLRLWAQELSYTMPELASAMQLGRPIDEQKFQALRLKNQMDIDQLVYIGDPLIGTTGITNLSQVTNVANVTGGAWTTNPDTMIAQINELLESVWEASGFAIVPSELRIPPLQMSLLISTKVSSAGNVSVLRYIQENNLTTTNGAKPLNIQASKWLKNRGSGNTQRMIAYTKEYDKVRFPMTPLQRTPLEWRSLYNLTTYWARMGQVESPYPETIGYRDGI